MSSHPSIEESSKESHIKIRCSGHLLKKYAFLEEALTKPDSNYFIQVTESGESDKTGGQLLFKLHNDDNM